MRAFTITGIGLLTIVALVYLWPHLPLSWTYHYEIKVGSTFADNIEKYRLSHGRLPDENDWETLKRLNTIQDYEAWWPEYQKTGKVASLWPLWKGSTRHTYDMIPGSGFGRRNRIIFLLNEAITTASC